jgi:CheY-like chemotaxis protein
MDHMMPEMDGIEATQRIRALGKESDYYTNLPIVALTANAVSGMKEMFMENGMSDFLAKPIEVNKLEAVLDKWIPKSKRQEYSTVIDDDKKNSYTFTIDGVDTKLGISMTGGNLGYYITTITSYLKDGKEKLTEINAAIISNDIALYTTYVHALKSASASIGAKELSNMAKELENAGKRGDLEYIRTNNIPFLKQLEIILGNVEIALNNYNEKNTHSEDVQSEIDLNEQFTQLKSALESMDVSTVDIIIKQLQINKLSPKVDEAISNIAQSVLLSDFDDAIESVDKILNGI